MTPVMRLWPHAAALSATLFLAASPGLAADAKLIAAAKKEGSVTWYTTLIVNQLVRPMAAAFEKKYGIKVNAIRQNTSDIILRVSNEHKAGRMQADMVDGTSVVEPLKRQGIMAQYIPDNAKRFPPKYLDKDGNWVAVNVYVHTAAYNTELVPKDKVPKKWTDLLDPMWKGKLVWSSLESSSSAPGFAGLVLTEMGQDKGMDFLKKLAGQNVANVKFSARKVLDRVMAGEYAIALQTFNHHSVISSRKGAPVKWLPLDLSMVVLSVAGITKNAPHPNAARLMLDFLTSEEGQKIFQKANYLPVDPKIPASEATLKPENGNFKAVVLNPQEIDDSLVGWRKVTNELFR
ncbi:MAG: ABC transporter substrate-binding protein [Beijerinckiaceae bacterium]